MDLYTRLDSTLGTCLGTALTYTGEVDRGLEYSIGNWDGVLRSANPIIQSVFGHELVLTLALLRDPARAREWGERVLPEVLKGKSLFAEAGLRRPLTLAGTLAGQREAAQDTAAVQRIESETLTGCPWRSRRW